MIMTGSQIIIECLKEQGVDTIFGYPGGAILNVYDELYRHRDEIRHILTSHEQGAAHAADGYARASGKVGVCFATSGPGATNLVTGIATAYMDSVPMVAITCNVNLKLLGKDSFQEVDIAGITMPITKHGFIVKDVSALGDTIRRAFSIARSGRPGPVLVDVTKDVTAASCEFTPAGRLHSVKKKRPAPDLTEALSLLKNSSRPLLLAGGGASISHAEKEVRELAELLDAPVCDTLMGKGVYPGDREDYLGMAGMHGTKASNYAISECDLLVALGARFSDRVIGNPGEFAPKAKILHIDIDPAEIHKNIRAASSVIGDLKEVLQKLNASLEKTGHPEWKKKVLEWKESYPLKVPEEGLTAPYLISVLDRLTDHEALITTDVGQHQMWAAQYYTFKRGRQLITSGGLGTMGYGLGAAIGAKTACLEKTVVNIAGDGCFRMNMNELITAASHNIPVIEIVINNSVLGMVRQWQDMFYHQHYSETTLSQGVDYAALAEAMGVKAFTLKTKEEVEPVLKQALETKGPVLIDCHISKDDKVFPMVPAGRGLMEVFDQDDYTAS